MASRHSRHAPVGEYQLVHITSSASSLTPVGKCVSTTSGTTITAGTSVVVTPASMTNIVPYMRLNIANGTGTAETVTVKSVTATTFTADFLNNHSGGYTIISLAGSFIGTLTINQPGSTDVRITIYNGHTSTLPDAGASVAIVAPVAGMPPFEWWGALDGGLFYTVTGTTIGDYTLSYLDMPI